LVITLINLRGNRQHATQHAKIVDYRLS